MGRKFKVGKTYDFYNMSTHLQEFWQVLYIRDKFCFFVIYTELSIPIANRTEFKEIHQPEDITQDEFIYVDSQFTDRIWAIPSIRDIINCGFVPGRIY